MRVLTTSKNAYISTPLRIVRLKRGETTREIARAVGINQSQYSRVENGQRRPSPELANRLAKYLGNSVTRDQILFPEDYMDTPSAPEPPRKPIAPKLSRAS